MSGDTVFGPTVIRLPGKLSRPAARWGAVTTRDPANVTASFSGEESATADAVAIDHCDRMFEVEPIGLGEHAIQKR